MIAEKGDYRMRINEKDISEAWPEIIGTLTVSNIVVSPYLSLNCKETPGCKKPTN